MTEEEKLLSEISGEIVTSPDDVAAPKVVKIWKGTPEDELGATYKPKSESAMDKLKTETRRRIVENMEKSSNREKLISGPQYD